MKSNGAFKKTDHFQDFRQTDLAEEMGPKNKNNNKKEESKKERDAREKQESKLLDECIAANIENLKETKISEEEEKKKEEKQ